MLKANLDLQAGLSIHLSGFLTNPISDTQNGCFVHFMFIFAFRHFEIRSSLRFLNGILKNLRSTALAPRFGECTQTGNPS